MISDATGNVVSGTPGRGNSDIVTSAYVEGNDGMSSDERINQQKILSSAVQSRNLGNLFSSSPAGTALGTGTTLVAITSANTSTNFLFFVSDNQGRQIVAVPDVAFYVNTFDSDGQWPNRTYGMGNMPASVFNDWGRTDNFNVCTRAIIRNNTGVDQLVYCVCRHRIIANPGVLSGTKNTNPGQETAPGQGGHV